MFPELRATVHYLYENRRLWNDMYLADIEADTFKTPAEKTTEKASIVLLSQSHLLCAVDDCSMQRTCSLSCCLAS